MGLLISRMFCLACLASVLTSCAGPGDNAGDEAVAGDEKAALEKAEAMIEDNRARLTDDEAGSEQ